MKSNAPSIHQALYLALNLSNKNKDNRPWSYSLYEEKSPMN